MRRSSSAVSGVTWACATQTRYRRCAACRRAGCATRWQPPRRTPRRRSPRRRARRPGLRRRRAPRGRSGRRSGRPAGSPPAGTAAPVRRAGRRSRRPPASAGRRRPLDSYVERGRGQVAAPLGQLREDADAAEAADPQRPPDGEVENERRAAGDPLSLVPGDVDRLDVLVVDALGSPGPLEAEPDVVELELARAGRVILVAPEDGEAFHARILGRSASSGIGLASEGLAGNYASCSSSRPCWRA